MGLIRAFIRPSVHLKSPERKAKHIHVGSQTSLQHNRFEPRVSALCYPCREKLDVAPP